MRGGHKAHLIFECGIETGLQFRLGGAVTEKHPRFNRLPDEYQGDLAGVGIVEPHLFGQERDVMVRVTNTGAVIRLAEGPHFVVQRAKGRNVVRIHLEDQHLYR